MNSDLYENTDVIKLTDKDFKMGDNMKVNNKSFKNKDGYIMFYANWCPNCQNKSDFWSFCGQQFNKNGKYANQNFRIGAIDTENPLSSQITHKMNVNAIPRFVHVNQQGEMSEYEGSDFEPESLLSEVCNKKNKLCNIKDKFYQ